MKTGEGIAAGGDAPLLAMRLRANDTDSAAVWKKNFATIPIIGTWNGGYLCFKS